jgi:hypothetical protein
VFMKQLFLFMNQLSLFMNPLSLFMNWWSLFMIHLPLYMNQLSLWISNVCLWIGYLYLWMNHLSRWWIKHVKYIFRTIPMSVDEYSWLNRYLGEVMLLFTICCNYMDKQVIVSGTSTSVLFLPFSAPPFFVRSICA